jgi:hypothetical protein
MSDVHIARTMQVAMRMIEEVAKQRAELQADRKQIQADRKQKEKDAKDASSAIAMNTFCGVHRHLSLVRPRVSDYGHGQLVFVCPWCISFDHFISIPFGSRVSEQDNCKGAAPSPAPLDPPAILKRPCAAPSPPLKRPASAKPDFWLALAPKGCPKCAYAVKGCTPSCWKERLGRLPKPGA